MICRNEIEHKILSTGQRKYDYTTLIYDRDKKDVAMSSRTFLARTFMAYTCFQNNAMSNKDGCTLPSKGLRLDMLKSQHPGILHPI